MDVSQYTSNFGWVDTSKVENGKPSLLEHFFDAVVLCHPVSDPLGLNLLGREISSGEERNERVHLTRTYLYRVYLYAF